MSAPNYDALFQGVNDHLDGLLGRFGGQPRGNPTTDLLTGGDSAYADYWRGTGLGNPTTDLLTGGGGAGSAADPWGAYAPLGDVGFFGGQQAQFRQSKAAWDQAQAQKVRATATEAGDWSGPATADENKDLTPEKIDAWIAATRENSPLKGKGAYILAQANARGISAPLLLGIFLKESELGTTAGPGYNLAGVKPGGQFAQYGSWESAIDGAAANLAGSNYKGKSAQDQIGMWYVGKTGDLSATDSAGNGTVQQYLDGPVAAAYSGLGVPYNRAAAGTRRTASAQAGDVFPLAGWSGQVQNHWGQSERGATDLFAPSGTPISAVRGGRVTWVGYDGLGGNSVLIHDDASGLDFYYAHMRDAPLVQVGQTVASGAALGFVGDTGDAKGTGTHLHLGIGFGIIQGGGASGGAGRNFDAVAYLQGLADRGRGGPPQQVQPGGGSGDRNY